MFLHQEGHLLQDNLLQWGWSVLEQFTILHPVALFQPSGPHHNQIDHKQLTTVWIKHSLSLKATWSKQSLS